MSEHNALVQFPQLQKGYVQAVGLDETQDGVVRLGETLTPTIDLWNGRREWALQRGEQWYARRTFLAAGAATTLATIGIGNPPGSGYIVVVERLACAVNPAAQVLLGALTYADFAAATVLAQRGYPMDRRRIGHQTGSIAEIRTGTPVGVIAGYLEVDLVTDAVAKHMEFQAKPFILYAGDALAISNTDDAAALGSMLVWYERKCVTNEARG